MATLIADLETKIADYDDHIVALQQQIEKAKDVNPTDLGTLVYLNNQRRIVSDWLISELKKTQKRSLFERIFNK